MTHTVTLDDFTGVWMLERVIQHEDGASARFSGRAVWQPDPKGLAYHETGEMVLETGARFLAERRYLWSVDLSVWFEDGRFFHTVPARGGQTAH
ncbi:MAG: trigger factor, partial [Roseovarius sp.]|nr:trigger factor [Roseovarius sp.]